MNKNIALIVVLIAVVGSIYYLNSQKASVADVADSTEIKEVVIEKENKNLELIQSEYIRDEDAIRKKRETYLAAPELTGITGYINTDSSITIASLKGKVVLVDFWTYTCINCIRTIPYLKAWHEKYADEGLVIIGVHTPEFKFEESYDNVKAEAEKYGLEYPIVQDNKYATWRAYNNRFWPRKYLIDIDGYLRYNHIGEGAYKETEIVIQELLNERMERIGSKKVKEEMSKPAGTTEVEAGKIGTPELYFGYNFARQDIGNSQGIQPEQTIEYDIPVQIKPNVIYLGGTWKFNEDDAELVSDKGTIILGYDAKVVNIVASSESGSEVEVFVDTNHLDEASAGYDIEITEGKSIVMVKEGTLYNLVDDEYGPGLLELRIKGKGFKINTFTFG